MAHPPALALALAFALPLALLEAIAPPAQAATTLVTATTSAHKVVVGHSATVSGSVTPPGTEPRAVVLQLKTATGWQKVRETTTSATGDYQVAVPTDWYDRHVLRVFAPATGIEPEGVSDPVVVTVTPSYTPRGRPKMFQRFTPLARWDPCRTVPYRTNLRLAPKHSIRLVRQAFSLVHEATGLVFDRIGSTTKTPFSDDSSGFLDYGLVVAWSTPRRVPDLKGTTAGIGGVSAHREGDGPWQYVAGGVVIDASQPSQVKGWGNGRSEGALMLHEIGHALGLDHTQARDQIMYPEQLGTLRGRYEAGDLAGLHELGAAQGCFG